MLKDFRKIITIIIIYTILQNLYWLHYSHLSKKLPKRPLCVSINHLRQSNKQVTHLEATYHSPSKNGADPPSVRETLVHAIIRVPQGSRETYHSSAATFRTSIRSWCLYQQSSGGAQLLIHNFLMIYCTNGNEEQEQWRRRNKNRKEKVKGSSTSRTGPRNRDAFPRPSCETPLYMYVVRRCVINATIRETGDSKRLALSFAD